MLSIKYVTKVERVTPCGMEMFVPHLFLVTLKDGKPLNASLQWTGRAHWSEQSARTEAKFKRMRVA